MISLQTWLTTSQNYLKKTSSFARQIKEGIREGFFFDVVSTSKKIIKILLNKNFIKKEKNQKHKFYPDLNSEGG